MCFLEKDARQGADEAHRPDEDHQDVGFPMQVDIREVYAQDAAGGQGVKRE